MFWATRIIGIRDRNYVDGAFGKTADSGVLLEISSASKANEILKGTDSTFRIVVVQIQVWDV